MILVRLTHTILPLQKLSVPFFTRLAEDVNWEKGFSLQFSCIVELFQSNKSYTFLSTEISPCDRQIHISATSVGRAVGRAMPLRGEHF